MKPSKNYQYAMFRRVGGFLFIGLALWYLSQTLSHHFDAVTPLLTENFALLSAITWLSLLYALSLVLLAVVWVLFIPINEATGNKRALGYIYGVTSIGKYFPGGIFHFGGRQAMGARLGISHRSLIRATAFETLATAFAALLVGAIFYWTYSFLFSSLVLMSLSAVLGIVVVASVGFRSPGLAILISPLFVLNMAILAHVCAMVLGLSPEQVAGAYLIAWCVGFIAPGVSAGIGVREAALVFLLSASVAPAEAAALAIVMRFITTIGDALFFLISFAFKPAGLTWKANN